MPSTHVTAVPEFSTPHSRHLTSALHETPEWIGGWALGKHLGEGSSSQVFAVRPVRQGMLGESDYALKLLRPELATKALWVKQFRREGILGKLIAHPNLMAVLDGGLKDPPYYLVFPRMTGATLAEILQGAGPFACAHALWVTRQIADALAAIHCQDWLHGDVKPENVFLSEHGHATLFDFGMATPVRHAGELHDRRLAGTLAYCAPEQFTSRLRIGPPSDVYSLGITLFELLTARRPFSEESSSKLVECHLHQIPLSPRTHVPHLPREVAACVSRMLAKDPQRRPTTDGELQSLLLHLEIQAFGMRP
jgi:eukaryotic-like serine/threonine-protein kinase